MLSRILPKLLDPSFVETLAPENFSLSTDGLFLMVDTIYLHSWYALKSSGKSLRTWPSISDAYLVWLERVEESYSNLWREVGIYEAIQLLKTSP